MSQYTQLVEYAAAFDPSFPSSLVPAAPEQIEQLADFAGRKVPRSYREFLETMGRSTGSVKIPPFDLRVETVIEFYRQGRWLSQTRYFRIANGTEFPVEHLHLYNLPSLDRPPEVIAIPDYSEATLQTELLRRRPFCGSLLELIAAPIFEKFELQARARIPERLNAATQSTAAMDSVETYLLANGFERLFFSNLDGRYFTAEDAAVRARQNYLRPLQLDISADSGGKRQELLTALRAFL